MYEEGGSKKFKGVQVLAKVPKQMQNGIKKVVGWGQATYLHATVPNSPYW